jgi:hypothetical protein
MPHVRFAGTLRMAHQSREVPVTLPKCFILSCGLLAASVVHAHAEIRTTSTAIGCLDPSRLNAAEEANKKHDRLQMDMLGCFPILMGVVARRIDDGKSTTLWQVRLDPDGPTPMEVWARPSSFRAD